MRGAVLLLAFAVTACGPAAEVDQHGDPHGYLILPSASVERGWAAVDAIQAELAPAAKSKIRTAAPIGEGPRMFVDFAGTCRADAALVEAARAVAARAGTTGLSCVDTPPAT